VELHHTSGHYQSLYKFTAPCYPPSTGKIGGLRCHKANFRVWQEPRPAHLAEPRLSHIVPILTDCEPLQSSVSSYATQNLACSREVILA